MKKTSPRPLHEVPPPDEMGANADLETEAVVLSEVITDPDAAWPKIGQWLRPHHFYGRANHLIFQAITDLAVASVAIDLVTVKHRLDERGCLHEAGGSVYLAKISYETVSTAHVADHAKKIVDLWAVRERMRIRGRLDGALEDGADLATIVAKVSQDLAAVETGIRSCNPHIAPLRRRRSRHRRID